MTYNVFSGTLNLTQSLPMHRYSYGTDNNGTTSNGETEGGRYAVVLISRSTPERVAIVCHIFTDDKNSSSYDGSTDQFCPLVGRFWVAVC